VAGGIPHLKTIIIDEKDNKDNQKIFLYLGSHNLTKAAWGTY
jgi:phosphatidylserine/phosphatidylglycerophosphate/cardiolipin synthase-like enzyme